MSMPARVSGGQDQHGTLSANGTVVASLSYEFAHCAVCGRADSDVVAEADDIRSEVEALWEYHGKRLRPETPSERLLDRVAFSEHPPYRLVRCRDCGLIYRNPVERQHELADVYAHESPTPEVLRSLYATQQPTLRANARRLRRRLGRGGSGLEVGSYVGAFLAAAREERFHMEGLDINPHVNAFTRAMGFTVHDGDLGSFTTDRTFDVVAILNTFDQLADPRLAVHAAGRLLRSGGVLAIRVPNGALYGALRRWLTRAIRTRRSVARAVLAQNNLLSFPYRWGFTPFALMRLLGQAGFVVEDVRGDVLVPIADEWTRRWARVEEMLVKRVLAATTAFGARWAPWFEVYARRA
jgi:SAM-dependent methyltransferase